MICDVSPCQSCGVHCCCGLSMLFFVVALLGVDVLWLLVVQVVAVSVFWFNCCAHVDVSS